VVAQAGGAKVIDFVSGRTGGRGTAMRVEGAELRAGRSFSRYLFARDLTHWRKTSMVEFQADAVKQIQLENAQGKWVFDRTSKGWTGTLNGRAIPKLSSSRVRDMITAFRKLSADDFAAPGADTGLDKKPPALSFMLEGGRRVRVEAGKPTKGGRFARVEGDAVIYVIGSWSAAWFDALPERFAEPRPNAPTSATPPPSDDD
jgi:hypothetical protein